MTSRKIFKIAIVIFAVMGIIGYVCLPDYKEHNSYILTSGNYTETTLYVVVYKSHYNSILYENIAERHNIINSKPDKLILKLYYTERGLKAGAKAFRTVIFDYKDGLKYILLE